MTGVALETDCLNCGAELRGEYCHVCGQKAASTYLGVPEVLHEVTHEFLHLDGKIVNTLKVLVRRPGQITKDLVEGRRTRYVTPLRLYLTSSVLFFLLVALVPAGGDSPFRITFKDDDGVVRTAQTAEEQRMAAAMTNQVISLAPRVVFVVMPVFALLTFALYRHLQPHFVAHLYYSLHAHAFAFLVFAAGVPLRPIGIVGRSVGAILGLWLLPYYYLSLRRFFGESWGKTIWKGTAIGFVYMAVVAAAMALLTMGIVLRTPR